MEPETPAPTDEAIVRARAEIDAMTKIVDALEPLDSDTRERVLAASAILSGVVSQVAVRAVLNGI